MASEIDICNLALAHLGDEATVAAIDPPEGSVQAEHCHRYYPIARNALLELYPWGFAKKRIDLVKLVTTPPDSWAYIYQYPNGVLTPLKLLGPGSTDDNETQDYVVEAEDSNNKVIYTNTDEAVLVYTALVTDTTKYSALFVNALARLLASYLAGPIIKGSAGMDVGKAHFKVYWEIELPLAKQHDANASKKQTGKMYDTFVPSSKAARS